MANNARLFFQGRLIERLYHSPIGLTIVRLYDLLNKNKKSRLCKIYDDILIEINPSKPGERGIPLYAFEPTVTQEFLRIVKEGHVVFDVGAWIGYYTVLAAKKVGVKGRVVSIEPYSENVERIRRNVQINNFSNVTILDVGVGDKPSDGGMLEGESSLMGKVVPEYQNNKLTKRIQIESLDNIINKLGIEKIDVLILDVEGCEIFALNGLIEHLSRGAVMNVICEIHPRMLSKHNLSDREVPNILSRYSYNARLIDKRDKNFPYHIIAVLRCGN